MIAVMGSTGNNGSRIARGLLAAGEQVRALGRSPERLAALAAAGADPWAGDQTDPAWLARALRGARAAFVMQATDPTAPDYPERQRREADATARALREAGVPRVVALSSLGADQPVGSGVVLGLRALEASLGAVGGSQVHLRPASFFENFRGALDVIRQQGFHADALAADLPIPMVGTRDIADAAVRALRAPAAPGVEVRELLGPRDLTMREATAALGRALGLTDLAYVQLPYGEMAAILEQAGLSPAFARALVELAEAINERRLLPRAGRTAASTTPTPFEAFAAELAREARRVA